MSTSRPRPPSVERVLAAVRARLDDPREPAAVLAVARDVIDGERERLAAAGGDEPRDADALAIDVVARLDAFASSVDAAPIGVINATGVIVHTNLGRAPWAPAIARAAADAAAGYLLLEMDRGSGRRGPRARIAEDHLVALTGAEDAFVTNNNAAALALAVGLVGRGGVVVSRGELVEIGGGVRIPDIVRRAGARLIEVGTTNRTRTVDFEAPLAEGRARAVLRVHPSNFTMAGSPRRPTRPPSPSSPIATGRSSSTTSDRARCSTRPPTDWRTSPCRPSGWPRDRTSSCSAATSWSAGRRPGSSSGGRTSSPGSAGTRWPGPCAPTSRPPPAWH